jgi:lactoylglutathione lyase
MWYSRSASASFILKNKKSLSGFSRSVSIVGSILQYSPLGGFLQRPGPASRKNADFNHFFLDYRQKQWYYYSVSAISKERNMLFNGFHHIGLWVRDSEKSRDFYTRGLGGTVVHSFPRADAPDKIIYLVDLGNNAVVEIVPRGTGAEEANARWVHIAIRTDDTQAAYDTAIRAGAESRTKPQDINLGTMPVRNAFVLGPDKEAIEFVQIRCEQVRCEQIRL